MKHRIGLIIGSLRRDSFNRRLAQAPKRIAPKTLEVPEMAISDLPLYNRDDDEHPHAQVRRLKDETRGPTAICS